MQYRCSFVNPARYKLIESTDLNEYAKALNSHMKQWSDAGWKLVSTSVTTDYDVQVPLLFWSKED